MEDGEILTRIKTLVDEEHELRRRIEDGTDSASEDEPRLTSLEEELDRCWDLLRQRRARRAQGQDPDGAQARSTDEVEHYLQ